MRSEYGGGGRSSVLPLILAVLSGGLVWLASAPAALSAQSKAPLTVVIAMTEFAFQPSVVRIPNGRPLNLVFVNRGQIAHQFETKYLRRAPVRLISKELYLEVNGLAIVRLQPATRARVQFTPRERGRFPFACTIEGHQAAGMIGYLDVR